MPIIEVTMREHPYEARQAIASQITEVICRETAHPPHTVTVVFRTAQPDMVASGGEMIDSILRRSGD